MEQDTQMLVERLEHLEHENCRIKRSARLTKIVLAAMGALFAGIATVPLADSKPPAGVPVVNAQQINLVNASGQVLASLGSTSDGNVLTFFDSTGKKTLTLGNNLEQTFSGLTSWDGNSIIPGTAKVRVAVGESNPTAGPAAGFGMSVWDGNEKQRTGFGNSYDLTFNGMIAYDPNGTTTGVDIYAPGNSAGFFANDLNGKGRQFAGIPLDNTCCNSIQLSDGNGISRLGMFQTSTYNNYQLHDSKGNYRGSFFAAADDSIFSLSIQDSNYVQRYSVGVTDQFGADVNLYDSKGNLRLGLGEAADDSLTSFGITDGNAVQRLFAGLSSLGSSVDTFDQNHNLTGHIP